MCFAGPLFTYTQSAFLDIFNLQRECCWAGRHTHKKVFVVMKRACLAVVVEKVAKEWSTERCFCVVVVPFHYLTDNNEERNCCLITLALVLELLSMKAVENSSELS